MLQSPSGRAFSQRLSSSFFRFRLLILPAPGPCYMIGYSWSCSWTQLLRIFFCCLKPLGLWHLFLLGPAPGSRQRMDSDAVPSWMQFPRRFLSLSGTSSCCVSSLVLCWLSAPGLPHVSLSDLLSFCPLSCVFLLLSARGPCFMHSFSCSPSCGFGFLVAFLFIMLSFFWFYSSLRRSLVR